MRSVELTDLGHPAYPRPKGTGDQSMPEKRNQMRSTQSKVCETRMTWPGLSRWPEVIAHSPCRSDLVFRPFSVYSLSLCAKTSGHLLRLLEVQSRSGKMNPRHKADWKRGAS